MKKNVFKYSVWFVILFTLFCIGINSTTRKVFSRWFDVRELKTKIEKEKKINLEFKKRLEDMKTKESLMEKYAKKDLDVLAEGEIEYHFNDYKNEDEAKQ